MKKYKIAAMLMLIHGGLMEIGGALAMLPLLGMQGPAAEMAGKFFYFIVPYLQENLGLMMAMSMIYGILRVIGAAALLKNRMWGLALSILNCVITLALMIFMLPTGIMDGLLAGGALVLMLMQYFSKREIGGASLEK